MSKYAVVVLADTGTEEGLGRVYNAMTAVKQLNAAGHEVGLYFDGTGTRWIGVLADVQHPVNGLYVSVRDSIVAVCGACADVFGAKENLRLLGDVSANEVDYSEIVQAGFQILNF